MTDDQRSLIRRHVARRPGLAPLHRLITLTNADMNEEAENSQALSTHQSLAVSSLSPGEPGQLGRPSAAALTSTIPVVEP